MLLLQRLVATAIGVLAAATLTVHGAPLPDASSSSTPSTSTSPPPPPPPPPLEPNLFFNLSLCTATLAYSDGWDIQHTPAGVYRAANPGHNAPSTVKIRGPPCTAIYITGRRHAPNGRGSTDGISLRLEGAADAVVTTDDHDEVVLAAEHNWGACVAELTVSQGNFTLESVVVTTGLRSQASSFDDVPYETKTFGGLSASVQAFANAGDNRDEDAVIGAGIDMSFTPPSKTAYMLLYGSVGPDHGEVRVVLDDDNTDAFNSSASDPQDDVLLYAVPLNPDRKYSPHLIPKAAQEFSRAEFYTSDEPEAQVPLGASASSSEAPQEDDHHDGLKSGAIIGVVIGAIVGFTALFALLWFRIDRQHRRHDSRRDSDSTMVGSDAPVTTKPRAALIRAGREFKRWRGYPEDMRDLECDGADPEPTQYLNVKPGKLISTSSLERLDTLDTKRPDPWTA